MNYSPTFCIFSNFFIDNEERFQRMKDSFHSILELEPKQWIINIRGRYSQVVSRYISLHVKPGQRHIFFLESGNWFSDTKKIVKYINSDFVFFWIEDHICQVSKTHFHNVLHDMNDSSADQLTYSFHHLIQYFYSKLKPDQEFDSLSVYANNYISHSTIQSRLSMDGYLGVNFYPIGAVSIMKYNFFLKVLFHNQPLLKRWPPYLPFDFEKRLYDIKTWSFRTAVSRHELFTSIDDDHYMPNSSLISQERYALRVPREVLKQIEILPHNSTPKYRIPCPYPLSVFLLLRYVNIIFKRLPYLCLKKLALPTNLMARMRYTISCFLL